MASDAILATAILAGMCLLMWALARVAKKRMGIGSGVVAPDALRIVGKRPLDQKSALWVVEIAGGRHILLGSGTDGTITKLDDISSDEYAAMVATDTPDGERRPRLRLARPAARAGAGEAISAEAAAAVVDADTDTNTDTDGDPEAVEQRFATVAESFQHLLGKARDARANRRASGD